MPGKYEPATLEPNDDNTLILTKADKTWTIPRLENVSYKLMKRIIKASEDERADAFEELIDGVAPGFTDVCSLGDMEVINHRWGELSYINVGESSALPES